MSFEVYAAGAVAAFTVDVLVYPLDTLKTRYQSQDYMKAYSPTSQNKPLALRGLYQGIGSVILATLPAAGLFFSTYESAKTVLLETLPLPQPLVHSAASSIAEMASCLVLAPAEVIKQNAQMLQSQGSQQNHQQYGSTSARALRSLGGGSGGAGRKLFTGYTALVARNLPFTALQFPAFEYLRASLWERRGGEPRTEDKGLLETGAISGVSAGTGGAAAAWVTTPSDVVKTRMMLSAGDGGGGGEGGGKGKGKLGAWDVTKMVWEDRGLRGFFRGALFRSGWTAMGLGLYLGTYDVAKVWLKRRRPEMDEEAGI